MKIKDTCQFSLEKEIRNFMVDQQGNCIILTQYRREIFLIRDKIVSKIDFEDHSLLSNKDDLFNSDFHKGAIFPFHKGFGVIFKDIICLWENVDKSPQYYLIEDSLPKDQHGRTLQPALAVQMNDENRFIVLFGDYFDNTVPGRFLGELVIGDGKAFWKNTLIEIQHEQFINYVSLKPHFSSHAWDTIDAITYVNNHFFLHTAGTFRNFARYGMDYSLLISTHREISSQKDYEIIGKVEDGYGHFCADKKGFILKSLHGKPVLTFYNLEGQSLGILKLTPKILGAIKSPEIFDRCGQHLWIGEPRSGLVSYCCLE